MFTLKEPQTTKRVRSRSYIVQGQGPYVLVWHRAKPASPFCIFQNGFLTTISVIGISHDETMIVAGAVTGEVLAWQIDPMMKVLENRYTEIAPIIDVSCSPGGRYLAAVTNDCIVQVWKIDQRQCIGVLPCARARRLIWSIEGSDLLIDGIVRWSESTEDKGEYTR